MLGGLAGPDRERRPPSDPKDLTVLILRDVSIGTSTNVSEAVALPLPLRTTQAEDQMLTTSGYGTFKRLMSIARPPGRRPQGDRLPAPLVHQDGGAEGVQRVLEECEVVGAPEQRTALHHHGLDRRTS